MSRAEKKAANAERVKMMADEIVNRDRKGVTPEQFIVDLRKEVDKHPLVDRPLFQRAVMAVEITLRAGGADMVKVESIEWLADQKVKQAKERKAKESRKRPGGGGRIRREKE